MRFSLGTSRFTATRTGCPPGCRRKPLDRAAFSSIVSTRCDAGAARSVATSFRRVSGRGPRPSFLARISEYGMTAVIRRADAPADAVDQVSTPSVRVHRRARRLNDEAVRPAHVAGDLAVESPPRPEAPARAPRRRRAPMVVRDPRAARAPMRGAGETISSGHESAMLTTTAPLSRGGRRLRRSRAARPPCLAPAGSFLARSQDLSPRPVTAPAPTFGRRQPARWPRYR